MDGVGLSIFQSRLSAVCEEMGAALQRASLSTNIKDRLDFSCAVFDPHGELCAQAAHIPVHLGSMAYAMRDIVDRMDWTEGDMVIVNDPYLGGTHLPDVTMIAPVFIEGRRIAFVANRAHHADIGAKMAGSMPLSRTLAEEGIIIPPRTIVRQSGIDEYALNEILSKLRNPLQARGDFAAQISANRIGERRLIELITALGRRHYLEGLDQLNDYAARLARSALADIPDGRYSYRDFMDDDGMGHTDIPIVAAVIVKNGQVTVDFTGTAPQTEGNINCPISVAAAAVYYVFRCLMPSQTPTCSGSFQPLTLTAPEGCLVNARRPAAVVAGNVETSMRIVDVIMGALAGALPQIIPAASQGTMNNIAMGGFKADGPWDYYETIGGGTGGSAAGAGASAVHSHMTNTRNTPIESLEMHFPLRIRRYAIRRGSGGRGRCRGGDGLIREYEFLAPATVTLLTERRCHGPWGLHGAASGQVGENHVGRKRLPAKTAWSAKPGDILRIETPGGGGWNPSPGDASDDEGRPVQRRPVKRIPCS